MRRRTALYGLGSLGLGTVVGCGSSGPKNPVASDNPDAPLRILDGRTGAATAAVPKVIPGGLEISAPGFLTLRTGQTQGDMFLWPDDERMPADFTRALVYENKSPGTSHRWPDAVRTVGVVPVGELASGRPLQVLEEGAALASAAHPNLTFAVGSGDVTVRFEFAPDDPVFRDYPGAFGYADMRWGGNGAFTGGRVVFGYLQPPANWAGQEENWWVCYMLAVAHELGHVSGILGHVPAGQPGLMGTTGAMYSHRDFIEPEKLAMAMQYHRSPGNRLVGTVEAEPGLSAQSVGGGSVIIVCS